MQKLEDALDLVGTIRLPGGMITGDWQKLEDEIKRIVNVAHRGLMKQVLIDRKEYGLDVPHHWEVDYGTDTSGVEGSTSETGEVRTGEPDGRT